MPGGVKDLIDARDRTDLLLNAPKTIAWYPTVLMQCGCPGKPPMLLVGHAKQTHAICEDCGAEYTTVVQVLDLEGHPVSVGSINFGVMKVTPRVNRRPS